MRAALLHGPSDLRVEEVPDPVPGPGEVVFRVRAALTCGTDRKTYLRGHPSLGPYPARFGHEFAGQLVAVGEGVTRFRVGDRVFCANSAPCGACSYCERGQQSLCEDLLYLLGGFAEALLVPARVVATNLYPLPGGIDVEVAALAEPLACAVHALERAELRSGDHVAIVGAGALGVMLTALARREGAHPVVLDPHEDRLELAGRFGAAATIPAARDPGDVDRLKERVPGGHGADQVFEAVGRPEAWELAIAMARPGGTVNLFGGCPPSSTVTVPTYRVHYEQVRLQGTYHHTPRHVRAGLDLLAAGGLPWRDLLGPRIGLDDLTAALEGGAAAKHVVVP